MNNIEMIDTIVPKNNGDFGTHDAQYGIGGWRSVPDTATRDAITPGRRTSGMAVSCEDVGITYLLQSDLVSWYPAPTGMLNPMSSPGDMIVAGEGGIPMSLGAAQVGNLLFIGPNNMPTWGTLYDPIKNKGDLMVGNQNGNKSALSIGNQGQLLVVNGGTPQWQDPVAPGMENPMTATGDLIVGGAGGTPEVLPIGLTNQVLTVIAGVASWVTQAVGVGLNSINVFTKNQSVAPVALVSGASIAMDASLSNNFKLVLDVNATLANPINLTDGMVLNLRIQQPASGGPFTLAYGSVFKFAGGTPPVLSTAANSIDFLSGYYDADNTALICNVLNGVA